MHMHFKVVAPLVLAGVFALYGCGQEASTQGDAGAEEITVVIGHVAPLTGK